MSSEKIDIIIPNYNKQPYITECLNSLITQTYTNWRCIVVDNFSDDGSWEIIQEFAKQDKRFELHQIPKPTTSFYLTWNFGLSQVKNPYFCILTSDDIWPVNWLETALKSLVHYPNTVGAAAKTIAINQASESLGISIHNLMGDRFFNNPISTQLRDGLVNAVAAYFLGPIYTSIHSLVMRSEILNQEKFAEDVGSTADCEWYIKLGLYGDIVYHPNVEVGWRIYQGQATQPKKQEENGQFMAIIHLRNRNLIAKKLEGLEDAFIKAAKEYDRRILTYHYARPCLANLRDRPLPEVTKLVKLFQNMPGEILKDFLYKFQGKSFFVEASIATTKEFYAGMTKIGLANSIQ